ncbi:ABC transporter ATP-binding protein [Candidatus Marinimicrobia bacterium]|nr:ABC transporter ATP-binding protein [Candidatus Neomarinimicrobiota bacterium]
MVEVKNIFKYYGKQKVLNDISLNISKGEIVSIVGSSGSGKTTLLRILSGLEIPESGNINLDEMVVNSSDVFITPEKRNCSLVFQDYALFPNMTMLENIYFGENSKNNRQVVSELIHITNIENILNKYPHECSGGEQQRVALVRSMANQPNLILMDEPLSNLDFHLKSKISSIISDIIRRYSTTAIIVTHDIMDAMKISDRIIVIDNGIIIQDGPPKDIYDSPNSKMVARFFGETNFIPLELHPKSNHHIIYSNDEEPLIHVRPNQFQLFSQKNSKGKLIIQGKIKSVKNIASDLHMLLECQDIQPDVHLILSVDKNLRSGQILKVMA